MHVSSQPPGLLYRSGEGRSDFSTGADKANLVKGGADNVDLLQHGKRGEDKSRNMSAGGGEEGVARKLKRCDEFT